MEVKKLDFYQPILSVRRVISTAVSLQSENKRKTDNSSPKVPPLPFYKSELNSGPVRNPGSVPFVWEQTPGRPKNERKALTVGLERPHIAPKLPPGRFSIIKQQDLAEGSKPMGITKSKTESVLPRSQCVSSLDENVTKYESSKEKIEVEGLGSEQGDDTYLDALDTISRTESFFMNCSISGLSSLDSQDVKPSGTFLMDPQTRDLMIGRFLPAAKAMASETLQHGTWKQPVLQEQLRQVEKAVARDKCTPQNEYKLVVPCQSHDIGAEDSEDEAYNHDGSEISSARVCGLFPRFCLKGSFCLLNPVPGMSVQRGVHISSVRTVKAKPSYASSCSDPEKEHARRGAHEQRSLSGCRTDELHENKTAVKSESSQTAHKSDYKKLDGSPLNKRFQGSGMSNFQNESFLSLHEEKGFLGLSEKTNNSWVTDSHRKGQNNFQDFLVNESNECESGSTSPVEKTVYVDSVHVVKSQNLNSSFPNTWSLTDNGEDDFGIIGKGSGMVKSPCVDSSPQDFKHLGVKDKKAKVQPESSDSIDALFLSCSDRSNPDIQMELMNDSKQSQDLMNDILDSDTLIRSKVVDTKEVDLHSQQPVKSVDPEGPHGHTRDYITLASSKVVDSRKISSENQQTRKSCTRVSFAGLTQDSVTFASSKVGEKINLESQRPKRSGEKESSHGSYPCLPLGPPLPKSPSESWLKRTLPTLSSRNLPSSSSLAMRINTRRQDSNTTSLGSNWERLVKSSNTHHGHLRLSEELLAPIPEA